MIPAHWLAYSREDDGELLGYLDDGDGGVQARTVFGHALGATGERADAVRVLDSVGLSYLAERWLLTLPDRDDPITVQIVEASPERLVVTSVDYGFEGDYGTPFTLEVPVSASRLRPERSM